MARSIVHMDLDSFFVSVERVLNSKLEGKPIIVGGADRGVVAACSYEARKFGVHSAMPARTARMLCPDAIFIRGDYEAYNQYSTMVTELVASRAPVVEKASIDEFYMDITGMDRYYNCLKWVHDLRADIRKETGLTTSIALSTSKAVSKMAVREIKPDGEAYVPTGKEIQFLRPLRVEKIPMIGDKTAHKLHTMGIYTVGDLAEIPLKVLQRVFGKNGTWMWERARGIDYSEVIPHSEQKSMSKESTFDTDTTNVEFLRQQIIMMVSELTYDLRQSKFTTGCVSVKIRYSDFDTQSRQIAIPYTASEHTIRRHALELFDKLYSRRMLIRLIGVRLSKLAGGGSQLSIFDNSSATGPLYGAMDKIRTRFGISSVIPASTLGLNRREVPHPWKKPDKEKNPILLAHNA